MQGFKSEDVWNIDEQDALLRKPLLKSTANVSFKYLVCWSLPIFEAMCAKCLHVLHQFPTFQRIHCASNQQLRSWPPPWISHLFSP